MTTYADFNRAESIRRGIDPSISEQVWNSEGGLTEPARVGKFPSGWSFWASQLHYGGAGYEQFGTVDGMGNGFTALTGWAPGDPLAWQDAMRYSLDAVKRNGWGPWHGATAHGITGFRGVDVNFPWDGTPDGDWDWKKRMSSAIVYDDYRDPAPAGTFSAMPKGVILHGSRSGIAGNPKASEYLSTARYEVNNPDELGWSATVGEGRVAVHLTPKEWGWNARAASSLYLGVEFAQATVDEPITDAQVAAFVDYVKTRVLPAWPGFPLVFPTHAELDGTAEYGGYHDGKTDVFPKGDARTDQLRARIMAGLGQQPAPPPGGQTVTQAEADALRAENARLQEVVNGLVTAVAVLGDDVADAHQAQVDKARAIRLQFVGPRPK